jgi:hypothetical protein
VSFRVSIESDIEHVCSNLVPISRVHFTSGYNLNARLNLILGGVRHLDRQFERALVNTQSFGGQVVAKVHTCLRWF